jgi:translation initiation factor 4G
LTAARSHRPFGFWDLAFPGPERARIETIADMVRRDAASFLCFDGFLVAERDAVPLAALSAYDSKHKPIDAFRATMLEVLVAREWSPDHIGLLAQRTAPAMSCFPDSPEGTWVVEWVAVKPEARGKGVAHQLLLEILERGRRERYENAQISYLIGNDPARTAYERVGFETVEEIRKPDFESALGAPGIARMKLRL